MFVISIDIGGTNIRSAIVNKKGILKNIIKNKSTSYIIKDIIVNVKKQVDYYIEKNIKIYGIGISIGGMVNKNGSIINVNKNSKWSTINIREKLKIELNKFKLIDKQILENIIIDNDGNCAAHCEKYFGNAKNCNNFLTVVLGTGVGVGIYINNKIVQHSEIGYIIEDKCSGKYFDSIKNNKNKNKLYLEGGKILGLKIAEIINLIDSDKVILSGPLLNINNEFGLTIKNNIENNIFIKKDIVLSKINNQGLLGIASMFFMY